VAVAVTISPAAQVPGRPTFVSVHSAPGSGPVYVELERATTDTGRKLPWVRTRGGVAVVPSPALVGTYRLVVHRGSQAVRSDAWVVRVRPRAARARSAFATPEAAARDWVAHRPGELVLVASRRWRNTALDQRDRRLNAFLVIAYAPRGDHNRNDRLGVFMAIARDRVGGPWRLLQVSVAPYGDAKH
jgi:hypothetical protein